jgi:hypothetical protein
MLFEVDLKLIVDAIDDTQTEIIALGALLELVNFGPRPG